MLSRPTRALFLWLVLWAVPSAVVAQDAEPTTFWKRIKEKGLYERLWEATRIYENEDNRVIQSLGVVGRYHGQSWSVHAAQGKASGWENRRMFIGLESVLFRDFTVQAQVQISEDFTPVYDGLYQAFVKWSPNESASVSAGRLDFLFGGFERTISSNRIATFERGLLTEQLAPGEVVGAASMVKVAGFTFRAGAFSGSIDREFTSFDAGIGAAAGVEHPLPLFFTSGNLHLNYVFNDGHTANNALSPYDHILAVWHEGRSGRFRMGLDLLAGHGIADTASVLGVTVLPTLEIGKHLLRKADALQAVLRLQYAASDGDGGLYLQSRYQQEVVPAGVGDRYQAVYAGLNYFIFEDRFKLMSGAEYSRMHSRALGHARFDGWTYLGGIRVFF